MCIRIYQKRPHKQIQQQKEPYNSSNVNDHFGEHIAMYFISFPLSIIVALFAAKIARYTFTSLVPNFLSASSGDFKGALGRPCPPKFLLDSLSHSFFLFSRSYSFA